MTEAISGADRVPEVERGPIPTAGDAAGVPVPHEEALENSSEEFAAVDGVHKIHPPAAAENPRE